MLRVSKVLKHPDFCQFAHVWGNDIGIIFLEKELTFGKTIQPVHLVSDPAKIKGILIKIEIMFKILSCNRQYEGQVLWMGRCL